MTTQRRARGTARLTLPGLVLTAFSSVNALAAGTTELSWSGCASPLVSHQLVEGGNSYYLNAYVTDQVAPFSGCDLRIAVTDRSAGPLGDAWRFDVGGCQPAGSFEVCASHPAFTKCPTVRGALAATQAASFVYDANSGSASVVFSMDFGQLQTLPIPNRRHLVCAIRVNHASSVTGDEPGASECGELERQVCFQLVEATYTDAGGNRVQWASTAPWASASGAAEAPLVCGTVSATNITWGMIKSQYR